MDEKMLANERILEAKRLVESVMAGLDTSIIDCPCADHVRHFNNWSDAQTHIRLQGIADRLSREATNDSVSDLTNREQEARGWIVKERQQDGIAVKEYLRRVSDEKREANERRAQRRANGTI